MVDASLAGQNSVEGAPGDITWFAIGPVFEYWSGNLGGGFKVSGGAGFSINHLNVLGSPLSQNAAGGIWRLAVRIPISSWVGAIDVGYQELYMVRELGPPDFGGQQGKAFERRSPGVFVRARF